MTSPRLESRLGAHSPTALAAFRIMFGLLFALHGSTKLFGWPIGESVAVGLWPAWWAGLIEFVAGLLVTVGFATRPAAFIASGQMAVAYFFWHWPFNDGPKLFWPLQPTTDACAEPPVVPDANGGEMAILYCFAFLLLVFTGPGRWAVDTMSRRRAVAGTAAPVRRPGRLSRFRRR